MRFCSINIYSGEEKDGNRKRQLTGMLRRDSDHVVDLYLQSFKYYNNDICISLNIACDEKIDAPYVEPYILQKGYPVLHIPFDLNNYYEIADKSSYWMKAIHDSVDYVCDLWNWDKTFFDDVYNRFSQTLSSVHPQIEQRGNERMKITNAQRKELDKVIKQKAKDYGYKYAYGFLFAQIGENFVFTTCRVTDAGEVRGYIHIKKMSYDNLFWNIMNMPDNRLQPLSFRANGAFTSPCILRPVGGIAFDEDLDAVADKYCSAFAATVNSFLDNNSVGEYVLTKEASPYASVLKCLENLDRGDTASALEIANCEIALGNSGGFSNEGKTFFEWVVHHYKSQHEKENPQ